MPRPDRNARAGRARVGASRRRGRPSRCPRVRRRAPLSPLDGVPVGVKDVIETEGMPTSYGSPIYAGHRPGRDAACVARLRQAGAVVIGKTTTTEFALYSPSETTNPHDRRRTPGGSSSGSAAAVAAGMVPLALGTQTAGSTVRPASFCGVFGFKPTKGWTELEGVKQLSPGLDTLGLFARDVTHLRMPSRRWQASPSPPTPAFPRGRDSPSSEPPGGTSSTGRGKARSTRPRDDWPTQERRWTRSTSPKCWTGSSRRRTR